MRQSPARERLPFMLPVDALVATCIPLRISTMILPAGVKLEGSTIQSPERGDNTELEIKNV